MSKKHNTKPGLTARQKQVLDLYNKGVSVKDIGANLAIKTVTVYATLKSARKRIGQDNRLNSKPCPKPSAKLVVKSKHVGDGVAKLLSTLESSFKSQNVSGKTINLGCTFHAGDARANPKVYELAVQIDRDLDSLRKLAKAQGKVFVRRHFIVHALADKLKEVLS